MSPTRTHEHASHGRCALTGQDLPHRDLVALYTLSPAVADAIRAEHPDLPHDALIARTVVARWRDRHIRDLLAAEHGELNALEAQVAASIANADTISSNVAAEFAERRTFGERAADTIASFGGSWTFILSFFAILVLWIGLNLALATGAFDPYPFILLNLVLSCLAAVQAPIIMMSQKRQEAKDRMRSESDYRVNLKAELEIRHLHEKIDHLLSHQWQRLAEIQQMQIDIMQERGARSDRSTPPETSRA